MEGGGGVSEELLPFIRDCPVHETCLLIPSSFTEGIPSSMDNPLAIFNQTTFLSRKSYSKQPAVFR